MVEDGGKRGAAGVDGGADDTMDRRLEFGDSLVAVGTGDDDGDAQSLREGCEVDADAARLGQVPHVQAQHDRHTDFANLGIEVQVSLDVGGVDDADDSVDSSDIGLPTQQHIDRDHLIERSRGEAVRPRQIDERDLRPLIGEDAELLLDRTAGEVRDPRVQPRERGEEGALAGIRVADQDNGQFARGCHGGLS